MVDGRTMVQAEAAVPSQGKKMIQRKVDESREVVAEWVLQQHCLKLASDSSVGSQID